MYHVAAVPYAQSDLRLTLMQSLLTFSQRLPNICSPSESQTHSAEKMLGGLRESFSKGWVAEWVSVG